MSKFVFFDVDGVVVHPGTAISRSTVPWHHKLSIDLEIEYDALASIFFAPRCGQLPSLMELCSLGHLDIEEALGSVLPELGYFGSVATFLDYWFRRDSYVDREVLGHVRRLRAKGYVCCLATSQEHKRAGYLWNELGLRSHFDDIFYSAAIGYSKKSSEFYRWIARKCELSGSTPTYFDDQPGPVEHAAACGWDAYLYSSVLSLYNSPHLAAELDSSRVAHS